MMNWFFPAIQNDRDRIGPTKKMKLSSQSSDDDGTVQLQHSEEEQVSLYL